MAEGVDAASFEFYEGIRIFIPGALTLGLAAGIGKTFDIEALDLSDNTLGAIFVALLIGLLFYFMDAPAKAAVITPLQPTELIEKWGVTPKSGTILNVYLLMLDTIIPPAIRARALYMGSMFRIGFEAVYLLFLTSLAALLEPSLTERTVDWHGDKGPWFRYAFVVAALAMWAFAIRREQKVQKARRKRAKEQHRAYLPDSSTVRFSVAEAAVVALAFLGFAVLIVYHDRVDAWTLAVPAAAVAVVWAYRYFRGYAPSGGTDTAKHPRRPINATHAVLLSGSAEVLALGSQGLEVGKNHLSTAEELGWSIVLTVALVLITARGHERRLRGAYSSQNTWLAQNKEMVLREFFVQPTPAIPTIHEKPKNRLRRIVEAVLD
jgi:preprotein translocase subunit YajC